MQPVACWAGRPWRKRGFGQHWRVCSALTHVSPRYGSGSATSVRLAASASRARQGARRETWSATGTRPAVRPPPSPALTSAIFEPLTLAPADQRLAQDGVISQTGRLSHLPYRRQPPRTSFHLPCERCAYTGIHLTVSPRPLRRSIRARRAGSLVLHERLTVWHACASLSLHPCSEAGS